MFIKKKNLLPEEVEVLDDLKLVLRDRSSVTGKQPQPDMFDQNKMFIGEKSCENNEMKLVISNGD